MARLFLVLSVFFFAITANGQIYLSKKIQETKLASSKDKKLFLVDFWATWCAPCITAGKYLSILQEQYRDDLYVMSMTKETIPVVERFMDKHSTQLAVALDFNNANFDNFKVHSLPWSVLFDADGNILWKGNPANIKPSMIKRFLRQRSKRKSVEEMFVYQDYEQEQEVEQDFSDDFEFEKLDGVANEIPSFNRVKEHLIIQGNIAQLVGYLLDASPQQIDATAVENTNIQYQLTINTKTKLTHSFICKKILRRLSFCVKEELQEGDFIEVELPSNENNYWDTEQFNWGESNPVFLVNDKQIRADNISDFVAIHQLFLIKKMPYKIINPIEGEQKEYTAHDWQIHHRFFDLMKSNLENYSIKISKKVGKYSFYKIAPRKNYFSKTISLLKNQH